MPAERPRWRNALMKLGIPDMAYIRRGIPVADVARALELRFGTNGLIHCWHPERHNNGDRTASVSILKPSNRVKCFGCSDSPLRGPIDLVADVLELTPKEAAGWIAQRFTVPVLPARMHLTEPKRLIHTVGLETPLGLLIRSGLWAGLSSFTQRLAPVLLEFSSEINKQDRNRTVQLSYRAIYRYVGAASPHALLKGLKELEGIGWLTRAGDAVAGPIQPAARYTLTPYSDQLQECANTKAGELKREIEIERQFRKERKRNLVGVARAATAKRNEARARCFSGNGEPESR